MEIMTDQYIPTINHFSALITVGNLSNNSIQVQETLDRFITLVNLHVVKKYIHKFDPIGETFIYILSESHLAIHTWPEYKLLHLNLVSCSPLKKQSIKNAIIQSFSTFGVSNLSLAQHKI